MKKLSKKLFLRTLIVTLVCFLVSSGLYFSNFMTGMENKVYDTFMQKAPDLIPPSDEISFIQVDEASIKWAQENRGWTWPWPREAYAQLVDFLSAGNVNSIGFDILFTDNSVYGEEDDERFASSCRNSGKVINVMFVSEDEDGSVIRPLENLGKSSALIANVNSNKDVEVDDIIRRCRLSYTYDSKNYPILGLAPIVLQGQEFKKLPVTKDGSVLLRYHADFDKAYCPYSACQILESYDYWKNGEENLEDRSDIFLPEDFEGQYVFCALYAPGLFDICSTPVAQVYPGCGVHITTLDNYLNDGFIRALPSFAVIIWLLLASFLGSFIISFSESFESQKKVIPSIIIGFIIFAGVVLFLPFVLFIFRIWLIIITPFAAFFLSFVISLGLSYSIEGKQKRFIKNAFSQCQSKEFVNIIVNNPSKFTLGGERYNMTAFFTDIQKFSSFSELLTASQLGALLNYYLTIMSDVIMAEGGTIDKYEGDAIVALIGAPVELKDHAQRACLAAIKMKRAEKKLNEEIIRIAKGSRPSNIDAELFNAFKIMVKNNKTIFTRIGINSGEMIAGLFGSERKKNYTMMGNNVNLASRLEGVNKQYCTGGILISEATRKLLDDRIVVRRLDKVRVVNVNTPIQLYEVLDERSAASDELLKKVDEWERAIELFQKKDYQNALTVFAQILLKDKTDNVASYYVKLIEKYFVKGLYPTEKDDEGVVYIPEDGVFKLMQK